MTTLHFTNIYVFGDGLSDMGRWGVLTNNRYPPSPPFFEGRWTNGPTWVETLAQNLNLPLSLANNYAMGGATTGPYNINEPLRLALQLDDSAEIIGQMAQIDKFLAQTETIDENALYILWAGGHDLGNYLEYGQLDVIQYPPAENVRLALEKLYTAGARRFMVGNMPDLANTPTYVNNPKKDLATQLVNQFNSQLKVALDTLESKGDTIIYKIDAIPMFTEIAMHATEYGFEHLTEAYLPFDYINFANPLTHGQYETIPNTEKGLDVDDFMSFWSVAPTAKVHSLIANKVLKQLE